MNRRSPSDDEPRDIFEALTGISMQELAERRREMEQRLDNIDNELQDVIEDLPEHEDRAERLDWYRDNRDDFVEAIALVSILDAMAGNNQASLMAHLGQDLAALDMEATGGVER